MKLHIKNGRVIDPASNFDQQTDVFVADGRIVGIGAAPAGFHDNGAVGAIDATGLVVAPGLVDLAARLREPGYEYKATLESEMAAAAAGGVTSLACPPDTDPPLDEPGLVEMLKHRARLPEFAKVYPVGALTVKLDGAHITEMCELAEAGCVAFGQANAPIRDTQVTLRAMQYAATFDFPVWMPAQDPYLARNGVATRRFAHNCCSVTTSNALERSSNTNNSAWRTNMRAAAARWICPPESLTPRGPTTVSSPWLSKAMSSANTAERSAVHRTASSSCPCPPPAPSSGGLAPGCAPMSMLSRSVSLNKRGVCGV